MRKQQRLMQRSGNMPEAAGNFEHLLDELQLNSSDTSPAESGSPDTRPTDAQAIQRADIGGSMRMPSQSSLRDDRFGSARFSVDLPRARFDSSTEGASRSGLHDRGFSSTRYTSPSEAQPTMRTKDGKSRGLWSRFKSGVGNAFGGSRREKASGESASDEVYSELRMDFAKRSRPSDADLGLIEEFKVALYREKRKPKTVDNYVTVLRWFSEFLQSKDVTLEDLLGDADLLKACKDDFMKVASSNSRNYLGGALDTLQNFRAGNPLSAPWMGAKRQPVHPEDERLIGQFAASVRAYEVVPDGTTGRGRGRVPMPTIKDNSAVLRGFARWLRAENRGPLTTRAFNEPRSLAADIEDYTAGGGDDRDRLKSALSHLRRLGAEGLQAFGPGPRLMGRQSTHPYLDDALVIDRLYSEAVRNLGPDSTREQRLRVSTMCSKQRRFSDWLQKEDRGSLVSRLNGSARQQQSLKADRQDFTKATGLYAGGLRELRKYLQVAEANRALGLSPPEGARSFTGEGARQEFPATPATPSSGAWDLLRRYTEEPDWQPSAFDELPATPATPSSGAWDLLRRYTEEPNWQPSAFDELPSPGSASSGAWDQLRRGLEEPTGSTSWMPAPSHVESFNQERFWQEVDQAQRLGRAGATSARPVEVPSDSDLGSFGPDALRDDAQSAPHRRNRLELGPESWLDDRHISADYELLQQELQNINPDLAARTRFVDPLVAYQLRSSTEDAAEATFGHIVRDQNRNDTADFLFLPVNDANPTDPTLRGNHWSLLLLDRRDRANPVAYHYDSLRAYRCHNSIAAELAARLHAGRPVRPGMAQQRNGYDCGVFLLDATRALAAGLEQGQRPDEVHLNDLVGDRQALRQRLRTHPRWG
ncbi:Ulp1 family isopeptidase [Mesorhizobium sp. WSM2239]|uniref:Ulp1 family isopeptidase n=2 Tax=unclassified Mesorhizobium TaxID=325217 RepID=A0AAU8D5U5_9HYPH